MLKTLRKILLISRPISWPNTAYPFAAGYIVSGGSFDVTLLVGTLFFLIPYNLLMYGINDIFDYESDMLNPRKGGIEGAKEQKSLHPLLWRAIIVTNLPFAAWFLASGTVASNIVFAGIIFFVIAYSAAHLRFKEIPVIDSITSSLHFVGPLVFALTLTGSLTPALPYVIAFFLWGIASHALGAVQDIIPDRKAGIASIATVFGARNTIRLVCCAYLLSAIIVIFQGSLATIVGILGLLYAANALPYLSVSDDDSYSVNRSWRWFIWLNFFAGFVITLVLLIKLN